LFLIPGRLFLYLDDMVTLNRIKQTNVQFTKKNNQMKG